MRIRKIKVAAIGAALALTGVANAAAAGTVSITSADRSGDILTVSGASTYTDQSFITVGTDAAGDAPAGQAQLGADLTGVSMSTLLNGQIRFRWHVDQLPPVVGGSPTGVAYGWTLCVDDTQCWDVDAQRMRVGALSTNPYGALWRCATSACTPNQQTSTTSSVSVAFDTAANAITATLSPGSIGAQPGSKINAAQFAGGPVFVWVGDASVFVNSSLGDTISGFEDFTVAKRQVSLAIGPPGLDPANVTYTTHVDPAANGNYTASLNTAGLSGAHTVYARACFGANNCAYAMKDASL